MTAFDSALLFKKTTFFEIYGHAFQIFAAHWKTFMGLGALQVLVTTGTMLFFIVVGFVILLSRGFNLTDIQPIGFASDQPYVGRLLLDRTIGISGASHLLAPHASRLLGAVDSILDDDIFSILDDDAYSILDDDELFSPDNEEYPHGMVGFLSWIPALPFQFIIPLFFLAILALYAFTASFTGGLIRATAEAYAGASPKICSSLRHGWNAKLRIFCYYTLLSFGLMLPFLLIVLLPFFLTESLALMVSLMIGYTILYVVVISTMTAALPSIVIENVSMTGAFKRSWDLCKDSMCTIFCKIFLIVFAVEVISGILTNLFGAILSLLFSICSSIFMTILTVVIYMGIRIEKEELTHASFNRELFITAPDDKDIDAETQSGPPPSTAPLAAKTGLNDV